jgi:hypothetical protein
MTRPDVHLPLETAYVRKALFGIELLDAVTLERVSAGVTVVAEGLHGKPRVNASGIFVWLDEDLAPLRKVTVDPGLLPYERVEVARAQLNLPPPPPLPLTTVELTPRVSYPFAAGITGMHGVLIEKQVVPPERPVPVGDAEVHLRWLDELGVWRDAPTVSRTDAKGGHFVSVVRLSPADVPQPDAAGVLTVRLRARRAAGERESDDLKLPRGRVADPSTFPQGPNSLIFAWEAMKEITP